MRLLDRYLLRELLIPLGYCLSGFLIFWVFADLSFKSRAFAEQELQARDIVDYYLAATPEFLVFVLPFALLLALLYTLTNLGRHHEITAIRAAGVSLWRLCLPYLAVGFFASLFLFALNELWVPDSAEATERIRSRHQTPKPGAPGPEQVRNLGVVNAREGRRWQIGLYNVKTAEMRQIQVFWTLADGSTRWLDAERAVRLNGAWTFYNVSEQKGVPGTNSLLVPSPHAKMLAMPQFSETPEQIRSEIKLSKSLSLDASKRTELPILEILNYLHLHRNNLSVFDSDWLYTTLHGRLAAPWACLVVVLIAMPFGAVSGRRNIFVGVAGSIVICFIYYVLLKLGLAFGTSGWVPAWLAAWFPNLSFAIAGLWMTARVR